MQQIIYSILVCATCFLVGAWVGAIINEKIHKKYEN